MKQIKNDVNRYHTATLILVILMALPFTVSAQADTTRDSIGVEGLLVEYLDNPAGVQTRTPRLSWQLTSNRRSVSQQAYQILAASSRHRLTPGKADFWNSGKVTSSKSLNVPYKGDSLHSFDRVYWKVRVWDEYGHVSPWSDVHEWKMGVLKPEDWSAEWVGSDLSLKPYQDTLRALEDFARVPRRQIWQWSARIRDMTQDVETAPAVNLRKVFSSDKEIEEAWVMISGLGLYQLYLNGDQIGHELNPAYSDYRKRVFYNMYEVTGELRNGKNTIAVTLGNGWYNLIIPHALRYYAADYIAPPKLLMQLRINYADGTTRTVGTDSSWSFTTQGPIRFNDVLGGETHDAGRRIPGWKEEGFDDSNWKKARLMEPPEGRLQGQLLHPVRKIDTLKPKNIERRSDTVIVDFGQELTGWVRMRLEGPTGDTVTIGHPGAPQHTLGRYQTDKYILGGGGPQWFEPQFSYKGFQRLIITGLEDPANADNFRAIRVQSDLPRVGYFSTSNSKLNKLQEITTYTIRNYNVHLPNDPTREKAAWSQDIQNAFDAYAYNFDAASMYQKWQQDLLDIQYENGYVPPVAPGRFDGHHINGPWWGGMIVYLPWKLYRYYGDRRMLKRSYGAMKKYVGYLDSIAVDGIVKWGLGDWREPNTPGTNRPQHTPVSLTSTVAYYNYVNIVAKTARILGQPNDVERYRQKAEHIKQAYNRHFYTDSTAAYATGSQASQLLSLYFNLVPDKEEGRVKQALAEQVRRDSLHLTTGFVATPYLLNGLTDIGYPDLAYRIATGETYPSWFDMIFNRGHSVLKEAWDGGGVQMPSLAGNISWYFYRSLAGIRPAPSDDGFRQVVIDPAMVEGLNKVESQFESPYGLIKSHWHKKQDQWMMHVTLPPNTRGEIHLPAQNPDRISERGSPVEEGTVFQEIEVVDDETVIKVGSGSYYFHIDR